MVYMEAYDKLLESWLTLVRDEEHFPRGCFVQPAVQVFNSYIQCHLAAPDGTRNLVRPACHCFEYHCSPVLFSIMTHPSSLFRPFACASVLLYQRFIHLFAMNPFILKTVLLWTLVHADLLSALSPFCLIQSCAPLPQTANGVVSHDEDEINELQEDDRELFSDQLASIGMLGRIAADHCIPLLTRCGSNDLGHPAYMCMHTVSLMVMVMPSSSLPTSVSMYMYMGCGLNAI